MAVLDRCFAYKHPVFAPAMRIISAITNSNPVSVTTTFAHGYQSGTIVRIDIPVADGMQQLNSMFGPITVTSTTTFTLPIDSTQFDVFAIPASPSPHDNICALAVPIGEITPLLTAAVQNVLPTIP